MSQNKRECLHCEHLFGCKKMKHKTQDCMYFEERKEEKKSGKEVLLAETSERLL